MSPKRKDLATCALGLAFCALVAAVCVGAPWAERQLGPKAAGPQPLQSIWNR